MTARLCERPTGVPLEYLTRSEFEEFWPEVSTRVSCTLRRRGVSAETVEDVIQEAATRAISRRISFRGKEHLLRWLNTVAWRLAIDVHRKDMRDANSDVPDQCSSEDVARVVEHRRTLDTVVLCLPLLSPADRSALVDGVNAITPVNRTLAVRLAVRRHRARSHLLQMMARRGAIVVGAVHQIRRSANNSTAALAGAAPAISLVAMLSAAPALLAPQSPAAAPGATQKLSTAERVLAPPLSSPHVIDSGTPAASKRASSPVVPIAPISNDLPTPTVALLASMQPDPATLIQQVVTPVLGNRDSAHPSY